MKRLIYVCAQSLCFCPPVCRCPRGDVGGFEEKPQVMFFFILLSYRLQQQQAWSSSAGLIPLLFPSTAITNVFDLQQTNSRSTDRIHKKSGFSERTSRGRETGQWGHITKSTSNFISFRRWLCFALNILLKTAVHQLHFLFTMLTLKPVYTFIYYIRFPLEMVFLAHVSLVLVQSSTTEKALANQFLAPGRTPTIANERMPATKTVHMQTKARCTEEMRDELLGTVGWDARSWIQSCVQHSIKI